MRSEPAFSIHDVGDCFSKEVPLLSKEFNRVTTRCVAELEKLPSVARSPVSSIKAISASVLVPDMSGHGLTLHQCLEQPHSTRLYHLLHFTHNQVPEGHLEGANCEKWVNLSEGELMTLFLVGFFFTKRGNWKTIFARARNPMSASDIQQTTASARFVPWLWFSSPWLGESFLPSGHGRHGRHQPDGRCGGSAHGVPATGASDHGLMN